MVDYCRILLVAALALVMAACQPGGQLESLALATGQGEPADADSRTVSISPEDVVMGWHDAAPAAAAEMRSEPGQHFIEFRARRGYTYGHSLVLFGMLDEEGDMSFVEVAGLTPGPEADAGAFITGHLVPVSAGTGFTEGDLDEEAVLVRWRIFVSEDEYRDVTSFIRELQASAPAWHATFYNCNAFVADIARHIGLLTPPALMPPQQFVTALRAMNSGQGHPLNLASRPRLFSGPEPVEADGS